MYTIAKYAEDGFWENYYGKDPKLGLPETLSSYFSPLGRSCGMRKVSYSTRETLEPVVSKLNTEDPMCGYAICRLLGS